MGEFIDLIKSAYRKLVNAAQVAAIAENPSVMTASGWRVNRNGQAVQDQQNNESVRQLRKNLTRIGAAGANAAAGAVETALLTNAARGVNASRALVPTGTRAVTVTSRGQLVPTGTRAVTVTSRGQLVPTGTRAVVTSARAATTGARVASNHLQTNPRRNSAVAALGTVGVIGMDTTRRKKNKGFNGGSTGGGGSTSSFGKDSNQQESTVKPTITITSGINTRKQQTPETISIKEVEPVTIRNNTNSPKINVSAGGFTISNPVEQTIQPGTYNNPDFYNRKDIRSDRFADRYSNVDEYWDYLNSGRNQNMYKLWQNVMRTNDGKLNKEAFYEIMDKYGIHGNLGQRDSRRLANLLNDLNLIGTEGTDARNAFINSYNNAFDQASAQ